MDYTYDKIVGERIKKFRLAKGWTQDQLSAKLQTENCDITRSTLAKIEVGQRHIYLEELKVFKNLLNVSYDDLLI